MASPENDGAEKYKTFSLSQLQEECKKREISFDEQTPEAGLIILLRKDDHKPTDWGVVYARLLNAGLRYDEIPERTIPQIKAILGEWANIISMQSLNVPNMFGSADVDNPEIPNDGKPPKLSQFAAMANMFNGIN